MSSLTDFQLGICTDHKGRLISDIWSFDDFWLEYAHDYIQWLFPIDSAGRFNQFTPLISPEDQYEFRKNVELKSSMMKSFRLMTGFWGLEWDEKLNITPSSELNLRTHIWLKRGGHNHLRISRVIRSLYLCGQEDLATAFSDAVIQIGRDFGNVTDETFKYWQNALNTASE